MSDEQEDWQTRCWYVVGHMFDGAAMIRCWKRTSGGDLCDEHKGQPSLEEVQASLNRQRADIAKQYADVWAVLEKRELKSIGGVGAAWHVADLLDRYERRIRDLKESTALAAAERAVVDAAMADYQAGVAYRAVLNGDAEGDIVELENAMTTTHFALRAAAAALADERAVLSSPRGVQSATIYP